MLDQFTNIDSIRRKFQKLACLDSILSPEWENRYYSYNSHWSESDEMASMRNGFGDELFLWISDLMAAYKIYSKEDGAIIEIDSAMGLIPKIYDRFVNEPAFTFASTSQLGYIDKGDWVIIGLPIRHILSAKQIYTMPMNEYFNWAKEHYEISVDPDIADKIWDDPSNYDIAKAINADLDADQFQEDVSQIGLTSR